MIQIYGTMMCKDCVACTEELSARQIPFTFYDFKDDLEHLKSFMKLRDSNPMFDEAKINGYLGIPCLILEDGSLSLTWESI